MLKKPKNYCIGYIFSGGCGSIYTQKLCKVLCTRLMEGERVHGVGYKKSLRRGWTPGRYGAQGSCRYIEFHPRSKYRTLPPPPQKKSNFIQYFCIYFSFVFDTFFLFVFYFNFDILVLVVSVGCARGKSSSKKLLQRRKNRHIPPLKLGGWRFVKKCKNLGIFQRHIILSRPWAGRG